MRPTDGSDAGGVSHCHETDNNEDDICDALPWTSGDGAVMHQRLEDSQYAVLVVRGRG